MLTDGPQRSEEALRAASNRLWHEYWMLRCAARVRTDDPIVAHALEETFALHALNLEQFLYGGATADSESDFVHAEDYMGARWLQLRPTRTPLLEQILAWAERRAGPARHDSAAADEPREWTLVQASFEMQKVMDTFISNLPRRLLGSSWDIHYERVQPRA
jgi:hypothetical protein